MGDRDLVCGVVDNGDHLIVTSAVDQNTGILSTLLRANGIAVLPAEREQIVAGDEVGVHMIGAVDERVESQR